jgi:thiol-disulfide isomerase/thioredoxin
MAQDLTLFNRVLFGIGVLATGLIIIFSFKYAKNQRTTVMDFVAADTLIDQRWFQNLDGTDSLQLTSYKGREVILIFWASWSGKSLDVLETLDSLKAQKGDSLTIIAAAVKDNGIESRDYIKRTNHNFEYVDGTIHYLDLRLPGVPSAIRFNRDSKPVQILVGESQLTNLY